jgi:hypothetical protein
MNQDPFDIRQARKSRRQILNDIRLASLAYPAPQPARNPRITPMGIVAAAIVMAPAFAWLFAKLLLR